MLMNKSREESLRTKRKSKKEDGGDGWKRFWKLQISKEYLEYRVGHEQRLCMTWSTFRNRTSEETERKYDKQIESLLLSWSWTWKLRFHLIWLFGGKLKWITIFLRSGFIIVQVFPLFFNYHCVVFNQFF